MILLTTLRGDRFGLNPDLVEEIRANGTNCVVTMITGRSFTAAEDVDTVHHILNEHRVEVLRRASTPADADADADDADPAGRHPDYLTPVPSKEQ
ncbi:flagellar FlbD family protein [Citricoccus nitrophenolicus]|uniref:Flagellar FlbD family protein n=1 Tax=Citricoccus nitrophenolicus TaxID=863575 RepID=A0ABV0IIB2_9MICC